MKFKNKTIVMRRINHIGIAQYCNPRIPISVEHGAKWRRLVRDRDKRRCQICGTKKKIVCHHIIFKIDYPELSLVENNGIILCKPCEDQAHGRELNQFIPKHIRVPSLKKWIRNRPPIKISRRIRILRWFKKNYYLCKLKTYSKLL